MLLPATLTADEAQDTLRLLSQAISSNSRDGAVIDASALKEFDSAALAVLLECQRQAQAGGRAFSVRQAPPSLLALAKLYGVHTLLLPEADAGS